jgi:alpha-D-ribose 1-methylphosphonate 5-triphosphate synthase subunit PhnH
LAAEIARLTFSPRAEVEEADYVFADATAGASEVFSLIRQVKRGSLWQPEESATLLVLVEETASASAGEANLLLSGPGIPDQILCSVKGMPPGWTEERHRQIEEYPLGIDLVFYTEQGSILALPRTTKAKEVASSWAM